MKIEIKAEPRSLQGTGASRRLRRESKVPGILYGAGKDAQPIQLDHKDLFFKLKMEAFHASILDMEIGAEKAQVLLRDYQMHPFKEMILHADFQRVAADRKIHVKVPLHFMNQEIAPGVKLAGGAIQHVMNDLDIACLPKDLPEFIELDISHMELNQLLHLSDVAAPEGVTFVDLAHERDPAVISINPPRREEEEVEAAEEEILEAAAEGEAEAPAEDEGEASKESSD